VVGAAARHPQGAALTGEREPVFRRDGDLLVPTAHARGPWDPGALHGGAPAALIAQALDGGDPDLLVARLTFDFLAPVPLAPLRLAVRTIRSGRRLRVAEAQLSAAGRPVLQARAVALRRGAVTLPPRPDAQAVPGGPSGRARHSPFPVAGAEGFHRSAMEIRFGGDTSYGWGPALAWFRFVRPLVDAAPAGPIALVAAAADFGNGVARVVDYETHLFPNVDMSIHLHRAPAGEWAMLDARTRVESDGAGLTAATLFDEHGPIGVAAQTLLVSDR
jgi:acyl-Coa thioesterase superfamily protein/acyl-CoA thioesterase superfamily protein